MRFTLFDTFNSHPVSHHKTLRAAVLAQMKHSKAVKRANGPNSYIPTRILCNGELLNESQADEAIEIRQDIVNAI
jgi:hypothetical protein